MNWSFLARAVVGAIGAVTLLLAVSACVPIADPTEETFYVRLTNDTTHPVRLTPCGTDNNLCEGKLGTTSTLQPGDTYPTVQTAVGSSDPWLVQSPTGRRLGCISIYFNYHADNMLVRVSELVPCQKHYSARSHS